MEKYEELELDIVVFDLEDVVTDSNTPTPGHNEFPVQP